MGARRMADLEVWRLMSEFVDAVWEGIGIRLIVRYDEASTLYKREFISRKLEYACPVWNTMAVHTSEVEVLQHRDRCVVERACIHEHSLQRRGLVLARLLD